MGAKTSTNEKGDVATSLPPSPPSTAAAVGNGEKPKLKACCACPETKKVGGLDRLTIIDNDNCRLEMNV